MSGDQITVTLLIRSILTVFIHLLGEQLLKSNSRSNNTLKVVINLDVNNNLTCRSLRRESLQTLTNNSMLAVLVSSLVTQLRLQGVFLARNQVSVGHSVLDNCTSRNLRSLTKISLRLNRRGPLSGIHSLVTIIDVLVLGNLYLFTRLRDILASLINFSREQLLKGDSRANSILRLVVDGDYNVFRSSRLLSGEVMGSLTQNSGAVLLGDQLCLQGVVLTRNKVLIRHGVDNRSALNNAVAVLQLGRRTNFRVPDSVNGLCLVVNVLVVGNLLLPIGAGDVVAFLVNLRREELLECNCSRDRGIELLIDVNLYLNVTRLSLCGEFLRTSANNSVLAVSVSFLVTQLSLQGVLLTRN